MKLMLIDAASTQNNRIRFSASVLRGEMFHSWKQWWSMADPVCVDLVAILVMTASQKNTKEILWGSETWNILMKNLFWDISCFITFGTNQKICCHKVRVCLWTAVFQLWNSVLFVASTAGWHWTLTLWTRLNRHSEERPTSCLNIPPNEIFNVHTIPGILTDSDGTRKLLSASESIGIMVVA